MLLNSYEIIDTPLSLIMKHKNDVKEIKIKKNGLTFMAQISSNHFHKN